MSESYGLLYKNRPDFDDLLYIHTCKYSNFLIVLISVGLAPIILIPYIKGADTHKILLTTF